MTAAFRGANNPKLVNVIVGQNRKIAFSDFRAQKSKQLLTKQLLFL